MTACRLQRLSDRVVWFTPDDRTDRPSLGAVLGDRATVIVNGAASPAHARDFLDALAPLDPAPLRAVVLTHWHWDHTFGAAAFDTTIIAQRMTARELAIQAAHAWSNDALDARVAEGAEIAFCRDHLRLEYDDVSKVRVPLPHAVFDDRLTLEAGGVTVEVRLVGGDHAHDSCIVHVPDEGVLFLGDCHYQRLHARAPHLTGERVLALVNVLDGFDADTVIEGHGEESLDRKGFAALTGGLRSAVAAVRDRGAAALDEGGGDHRELVAFLLAGEGAARQ